MWFHLLVYAVYEDGYRRKTLRNTSSTILFIILSVCLSKSHHRVRYVAHLRFDFGIFQLCLAKTITCANDEARKMFVEAYGHMLNYNHEQAIACFMACTELDPECAMAWWGIAYCVSSNYTVTRTWFGLRSNPTSAQRDIA